MSNQKLKYSAINLVLAFTIGGQVEAKKDGERSIKSDSVSAQVESMQAIEPWMFNELVPAKEVVSLEDWMFRELVPAEETAAFEDWMFETDYFLN
jgi:hypothetical protein